MDNENTNSTNNLKRLSVVGVVVKTKIRNKILSLVIVICILTLISVSAAAYFAITRLADNSKAINAALSESVTDGAGDALTTQANHFLQVIAKGQSGRCDGELDTIKLYVQLLEGVVQDAFNYPKFYSHRRPVVKPSARTTEDGYENTYSLPASVEITPEIERELDLLSNLYLLMPTLTNNPNIVELYVGMESGLFYNYSTTHFENPEYDPRVRPWYIAAVKSPDDVIFTDIYEDSFGSGMVLTAAKAVFDSSGKLLGVAAIDILLENFKEMILGTRITDSGYAFIINSEGMYVVHPDMGGEDFEPYVSLDEGSGMADGYKNMMNGEEGYVTEIINGERYFLIYSPISVAGWSVGLVIYEDEILSSLKPLKNEISLLANESEENTSAMTGQTIQVFVLIFIFVSALVAFLSVKLTQIVSRPIQKLTEEVVKIGEGNFEYRIPVETHDEVGFLTEAFNNMADNLYNYAQNIIALNKTKSELEITANTDALTGITNRRRFMELAPVHIDRALLEKKNAYVIMFDLDHFKSINDTYGHQAGDKVLKTVAQKVSSLIRNDDLFARYGGEEFVISITGVRKKAVVEITERIRQNICKEPVVFENMEIPVSASFGIAAAKTNKISTVIAAADKALYIAKDKGRNRVIFNEKQ